MSDIQIKARPSVQFVYRRIGFSFSNEALCGRLNATLETVRKLGESHPRQRLCEKSENPTHGSGWIVQTQPTCGAPNCPFPSSSFPSRSEGKEEEGNKSGGPSVL